MKLVTLEVFEKSIDAHLLKTKLESEGIPCFLFDENIVSMNLLYNNMVGGIKLKVGEESYEEALKIMEAFNTSPTILENGEQLTCPKCQSTHIDTHAKSFKDTKGVLSILLSFLFFIYPIHYKETNRCNNCGHTFE